MPGLVAGFAATALGAQPPTATPGAALPSPAPADARWLVDESGLTCSMGRAVAAGPVSLLIQTYPGSGSYDLSLVLPQWHERPRMFPEPAVLSFAPDGGSLEHEAMFQPFPDKPGGMLRFLEMPAEFLDRFGQATSLRVTYGRREVGNYLVPQAGPVSRVFADCEANKLVEWGANPAGFGPGTRRPRPIGDPNHWVVAADLPNFVRQPKNVTAAARLNLDAAGRIQQCTLIDPSGFAALDNLVCRLLRLRARYEPARARDGNAVETVVVYRVHWISWVRFDLG